MNGVVATSAGAVTSPGNDVNDYWQSITNGVSGVEPLTKFACKLKKIEPLNHIEKAEAGKYDAITQYALISVEENIKFNNIYFENLNKNEMGVIWGSGNAVLDYQSNK